MTSSAYRANGPKLAALYHHSGEAFDWLYDNALVPAGIEAEPTFPAFPGIMMEVGRAASTPTSRGLGDATSGRLTSTNPLPTSLWPKVQRFASTRLPCSLCKTGTAQ